MLVADNVFKVLSFIVTKLTMMQVLLTEILVFGVMRLLSHLMEVLGVKLKGAHLLLSRQVMAVVKIVIVLMLGVRREAVRVLREILMLVVHWLLLNLVEMMGVKFESAELLTSRQTMSVIEEVVILVLCVRSEVLRFLLLTVLKHVIFTTVAVPVFGIISKLLVLF